jgi:hypothetical protein
MKLRARFVHVHRAAVKHRSIQCRNSALGFRRLGHLHKGDAAGFARIPVLDDRDGFDVSVGCKNFPQLLPVTVISRFPTKTLVTSSFSS